MIGDSRAVVVFDRRIYSKAGHCVKKDSPLLSLLMF
jgi:hypothetical protein